jgi:hypothetical protein
LFNQYFQYGYWKVRVIRKHRLPASVRHLVPATFVLGMVLLPLTALLWPPAGMLWLALFAMYATASALTAVSASRQSGWDMLVLMPAVCACYHLGYGLGFLAGLGDALLRRSAPRLFSHRLTRPT